MKGLVRSADHVVMDMLAHSCLQEGANAATNNIHLFRHLDNKYCRDVLAKIRAKDKDNGILVLTEGLFSMDSTRPGFSNFRRSATSTTRRSLSTWRMIWGASARKAAAISAFRTCWARSTW